MATTNTSRMAGDRERQATSSVTRAMGWRGVLASILLLIPTAGASAQFHGIAHQVAVPEAACEGGLTRASTRARNDDGFGDVLFLHQCYHRLATGAGELRIPDTGSLPAVNIEGNAVALGDLATGPWLIGPPSVAFSYEWMGEIYALPEEPEPGRVTFEQNTYVVQPGDPAPLPMTSVVIVEDLCNEGGGGCSTDPSDSEFNAQIMIVDPGILVEATTDQGDPPRICEGETVDVTYTYTVTNSGDVDLANVVLTDSFGVCDFSVPDSGDDDDDGELDLTEVWIYECTVPITGETTSTVNVSAESARDTVSACTAESSDAVTIETNRVPQCAIDGPTLVCPGETEITFTVTETSEPPLAVALFEWTIEGAGLFCDGSNTASGDTVCVNADVACDAIFTLTVRVVSEDGCESTCTRMVTVDDDVPPVIMCPPDAEFECAMGDAGEATATDDCDPDPTISFEDNEIPGTCPQMIERTWTATDSCGNTDTCVQRITIDDTNPPVITCPPDIDFECEMGDAGEATATDMCDPDPTISFEDNEIPGTCPREIERTWTATDFCGNSDSCVQRITIDDTDPPVITCPPDIDFECVMGDAGEATATDMCDPDPTISFEDNEIPGTCPREIERTWTATDLCGNSDSCVQRITIDDTDPPVITCPPDVDFECVMGDAGEATATDMCDPAPTITFVDNEIPGTCPREIERTWTAMDLCGNSDSCVQRITIDDTTPPVITCPPDIDFECAMGDAGEATATDECDPDPTISFEDNEIPGTCPQVIERTWTATDLCGNGESCVQRITIDDTIAPTMIVCPPDTVLEDCLEPFEFMVEAEDNCPGGLTYECTAVFDPVGSGSLTENPDGSYTLQFLDGFPAARATITCLATDACGNTSDPAECTFTVSCGCCEVVADVEGCVILPPDPPGDACDGKVTELVFRYTGEDCSATSHTQDPSKVDCDGDPLFLEPVRVVVTDKDENDVFADMPMVDVGGNVVARADMAGEDHFPSETKVRIYDQDGNELQYLRFHTSCSQPLGPGDQFGSLLLVSMTSTDGGYVELPGEGDPGECIKRFTPSGTECDGKVLSLDLRYTGGDCSQTSHAQDPSKVDCDGDAGVSEPVRILVTDKDGHEVYADESGVMLGDTVVASAANAGEDEFDSETKVWIYDEDGNELQYVRFHTSCSQPLRVGDQFGALQVFGMTSTEGGSGSLGTEVEYTYTITNLCPNNELIDITAVDDLFGPVPGAPDTLGPDETWSTTVTYIIFGETTNTFTVTANGEDCGDADTDTIFVDQPPVDCCEPEKPNVLTMLYTGDDCSGTQHAQDPGKVECDDYATLTDVVQILSSNKSDPFDEGADVWFDGFVSLGAMFDLRAANAGKDKFSSATFIHIFDLSGNRLQSVEFHTSCSQPLFSGDRFGASELVTCGVEEATGCCAAGKPKALHMRYTGEDCSASNHGQDPNKVECDDHGPLTDEVFIIANSKKDPAKGHLWFAGTVSIGETFDVDAENDGKDKLKSNTYIHVYDEAGGTLLQKVKFHTSCSQPLSDGDQYGSALLLSCTPQDSASGMVDLVVADDCPADLDASDVVDFLDVVEILANWGVCESCDPDLDEDGLIGFSDLMIVLGTWGPCS